MNSATDISAQMNRPRRHRSWLRLALAAIVLFAGLTFAGFLFFSSLIEDRPVSGIPRADGIVVLTGGQDRIPEGIKLLSQGKGQRLLISGVNPITTRKELASLTPNSKNLFRCCIDVDQVARDTIGNANETRHWVEQQGFRSLIVVTSSYHMPRSLAELRRALPDTQLIAYPVMPSRLHVNAWWAYKGTLKLLAKEYVKFIPAFGRCLLIQIGRNRGVFGGARRCLNAPVSS